MYMNIAQPITSGRSHTKECIDSIQTRLRYREFAPDCKSDRDLCELLSDGEILCDLLTEVSNGRISYEGATYTSANSHVLARKNVVFFLTQCRDVLGIPASDLFEPDDLLSMGNPERVVKAVLKIARKTGPGAETEEESIKTRSRGQLENVIKEICDHERLLIEKLETLIKYRSELLSKLSEWSQDLVQVAFRHVDQLIILHKDLHARLSSLAERGCDLFCKQFGGVFSEFTPKLEIYVSYFAHLPVANTRMETEFKKNPRLKAQLGLLERSFGGLSFRGLFDAPIRQTTNYLQLFKRLHKTAETELPEAAKSVEDAMVQMEKLLHKANTFKRQAEQLASAKEVLSQIGNLPADLANPELVGWHLADDYFKVRAANDATRKTCFCVLTTKQLILASRANKKETASTFMRSIPIVSSLQVKVCDRSDRDLEIVQDNGDKVTLEVKPKCHHPGKWVAQLKDVIALNFPEGWNARGHSFELKTFPSGTKCSLCSELLAGTVMQGYSCDHCDKRLHSECLKEQIRLKASDYYHKSMTRDKAEELLRNRTIGTFLIRDSQNVGVRVISIKSGSKFEHITIAESNGRCTMGNATCWRSSLDELLQFYTENLLSISFKDLNFKLGEGVEPASAPNDQKQRPESSWM